MKKWISAHWKLLLLVTLAVILFVTLGGLYLASRPTATAGGKHITLTVVDAQQKNTQFAIATDAEFLRGALEQEKLIVGEESAYGLFVKTVSGITADDSKQEWWCFTKNGESLMTGVDTTPIYDGDAFTATLTTGY